MIGDLDHRIQFYAPSVVQSSTGEPTRTYALHRTCWAWLQYGPGGETIAANTPTVTRELAFVIRYITGLNEKMRIVYNSENYNVTSIEEIDRRRYLKVTATKPDNE